MTALALTGAPKVARPIRWLMTLAELNDAYSCGELEDLGSRELLALQVAAS